MTTHGATAGHAPRRHSRRTSTVPRQRTGIKSPPIGNCFSHPAPTVVESRSTALARSSAASRRLRYRTSTSAGLRWCSSIRRIARKGIGTAITRRKRSMSSARRRQLDSMPRRQDSRCMLPLGFRDEYRLAADGTSGHGPPAAAARRRWKRAAVVSGFSRTVLSDLDVGR